MDVCLIYSTHPTLEQARLTASALLDAKLAGCCNILGTIESHYDWQGARENTPEVAMISKTTPITAPKTIAAIKASHPYDTPAILQIPLSGGNEGFLNWIAGAVSN